MKRRDRHHRGYRYPVPIDGYDYVPVCFQIPDHPFYRAALRGSLERLARYWSWYNDDNDDLQQRWDVARIWKNLLVDHLEIGSCHLVQVRQSLLDPCFLQVSYDGGETWQNFANLLLCEIPAASDYYQQLAINEAWAQIYQDMYDGTPHSINPEAPDTNFDGDGSENRQTALCMAAQALVGSYAAQKVQQLDKAFGGVFILVALVVILTGGITLPVGLAIGGAFLVGGWSYQVARTALVDKGALQAVACCMADALEGVAVNQVNFQGSLSACGFTPGSNEMIVRDFVNASIQELSTYLSFLDALGKAYVQVRDYAVNECGCDWLGQVTFDDPDDLPFVFSYGFESDCGYPGDGGEGQYWQYEFEEETYRGFNVTGEAELDQDRTITRVTFNFEYYRPSAPTQVLRRTVRLLDSSRVELAMETVIDEPGVNQWLLQSFNFADVEHVRYVEVAAHYSTHFPDWQGHVYIDNIRVYGS